ncbi:DUF6344 domain-containing protein [Streptomyces sp. bgisy159]|uniref:DUF6344 domain-containing protein n=1 Tax=Streptomyces sp. bgisy159 TaxID=3413795 RepID=UPI003F4A743F
MAKTQVMKVWTAFVTAFLALCTALGLITTTAATAVAQSEPARNSGNRAAAPAASPALAAGPWSWTRARALPPTMKQRIRAEAHGKSPSCRHRSPDEPQQPAAQVDADADHANASHASGVRPDASDADAVQPDASHTSAVQAAPSHTDAAHAAPSHANAAHTDAAHAGAKHADVAKANAVQANAAQADPSHRGQSRTAPSSCASTVATQAGVTP